MSETSNGGGTGNPGGIETEAPGTVNDNGDKNAPGGEGGAPGGDPNTGVG